MSDTVLDKIAQKAAEDAEAIRAAGAQRAAALTAEILEEAAKRVKQIREDGAARAEQILRGGRLQAASEAKIRYLNRQYSLLQDARRAAKEALLQLPDAQKNALLGRLCATCGMSGTVSVTVPACEADRYADGALLRAWSERAVEERGKDVTFVLGEPSEALDSGVILCGEIYDVDLSFDTLLDGVTEQHGKAIADCLFGTGERHDG